MLKKMQNKDQVNKCMISNDFYVMDGHFGGNGSGTPSKTLGYSKSFEMHDRIIGIYIERKHYVLCHINLLNTQLFFNLLTFKLGVRQHISVSIIIIFTLYRL